MCLFTAQDWNNSENLYGAEEIQQQAVGLQDKVGNLYGPEEIQEYDFKLQLQPET